MRADDDTLRALLLHRLSEQDVAAHSERIVLEAEFCEQLQDLETDLLDDYARGRLTAEDRAAVERYLLVSPTQRERVRTARALSQLTQPRHRARRALLRWAVPTGALLAAGIAGLSLAPALITHWTDPVTIPSTLTQNVSLLADSQRSRTVRTLHLNPGASQIRLQLEIPGPSAQSAYRLVIAGDPGSPVQVLEGLEPIQSGPYRFIEVSIPVRMLARGAHRLTLTPAGHSESPLDSYDWLLQTD